MKRTGNDGGIYMTCWVWVWLRSVCIAAQQIAKTINQFSSRTAFLTFLSKDPVPLCVSLSVSLSLSSVSCVL